MRKVTTVMATAVVLMIMTASLVAAEGQHIKAPLVSVGNSGVTGTVQLVAMPHGGTNIHVVARGLTAGTDYISLYYDNNSCQLEPYSFDDVVGNYSGNVAGLGKAHSKVGDDLDEINSVSVRLASDLTLLACAVVHP